MKVDFNKQYVTIENNNVRFIHYEKGSLYPFIGYVDGYTQPHCWKEDGTNFLSKFNDLKEVHTNKTLKGYVNIDKYCNIGNIMSEYECKLYRTDDVIACVPIEISFCIGEGLDD